MRKVGNTESGNVLVELAPDEWAAIQRSGTAWPGCTGSESLYQWEADFGRQLIKLDLPVRVFNTLSRAISVSNTMRTYNPDRREYDEEIVKPYIAAACAFTRGSNPMSFDSWLALVAAGYLDADLRAVRNLGKKGIGQLKEKAQALVAARHGLGGDSLFESRAGQPDQ